jgi:hypothetical protein
MGYIGAIRVQIRLPTSFMCLSQALSLKEPLVDAVQPLLLCFREQRIVLDIEQVIDDEPDRLRSGHPVLGIEPFQVHGNRIPSQRPLPPQIEVNIEVAECQLPQAAVHGLAPSASRIVGFRYRSPASLLSKDSDHVIGVVVGFKIEQQRRISIHTQSGRREDCSFQAMRCLLGQYLAWRPGRVFQVVGHVVEKFLDAVGILQGSQFAQLSGSETEVVVSHFFADASSVADAAGADAPAMMRTVPNGDNAMI